MSTTQPVQPIRESVIGTLRNCLQIGEAAHEDLAGNAISPTELAMVLRRVTYMVRFALAELQEPNLAAMQAGEILLREWSGTPEPQRQLRDTVAGIIAAQISGIVPRTWE